MRFYPLGDAALVIEFGTTIDEATHRLVCDALRAFEATPLPGVVEVVPAYTTLTLFYDLPQVVAAGAPIEDILGWLGERTQTLLATARKRARETNEPRLVRIPVCYGGEHGPDLPHVAQHTGLSPDEVIRCHTDPVYRVYSMGFAPGFPYLGGLSPRLAAPRRATPRPRVTPGSVGIAGTQTGVYPLPTPGGWQLIGRTPLRLFRPEQDPPVLLRPGDRVRFVAVDTGEFATLGGAAL